MKATPVPSSTCFPLTEADVWAAVGEVFLAIEACGARYNVEGTGLVLSPLEKAADLLAAGAIICGKSWGVGEDDCPSLEDLAKLPTSIAINGTQVATGDASLCPLGSPLASLTWLANHLPSRGQCLRPGEAIITGACSKTKAFAAGDKIVASFGTLGSVALEFKP